MEHSSARRLFTTSQVMAATDGRLHSRGSYERQISSVCIDSRTVSRGSLFIALKGERTDGHLYVRDAAALGAHAILADASRARLFTDLLSEFPQLVLILVDDTYKALRMLATWHLQRYPDLVKVSVTGSSGKTTTKEMIASVLSQLGPTVKNPGNFNSDIGLPLSVFAVDSEHEYGVFEMGINHFGEMERMLEVYRPDVGLMTNIGTAHIGYLGSKEAIAREKSLMFHGRIKRGYILETNVFRRYISRLRGIDLELFGFKSTEGFSQATSLGLDGWNIRYEGIDIHLHHIGTHNLLNALAACKVAQGFGATRDQIKAGLESAIPLAGRSRVIQGAVTVIEDSYNSNLEATESMLGYVANLPWEGRKNVVLGSMKELGSSSPRAHNQIGRRIASLAPEGAFLYGREMESAYDLLRSQGYDRPLFFTDEYQELEQKVTGFSRPGDLLLLKGSRAMGMERLVEPLGRVC